MGGQRTGITPSGLVLGGNLWTTVVRSTADLVDALENDRGDTFIAPGLYTIDTDTVGPIDTTPRIFHGAGRQEQGTGPFSGPGVIIEFVGAGGSITSLDFTAGLTESEGVEWEDVSMFSSSASLASFLVGLYGAKQVNLNGGSVTIIGFADCFNLVNCSVVNLDAGGIAFFGSTNLVNCTAGSLTAGDLAPLGFFICENLVNCNLFYEAGALGGFTSGFTNCQRLSNCMVDASLVTSVIVSYVAFDGCTGISNCHAIGPVVGSITGMRGFRTCIGMANCFAVRWEDNYLSNQAMTGCGSIQGVLLATGAHYTTCFVMANCTMDGSGDAAAVHGFDACTELSSCRAEDATGNGFNACLNMGASFALNCGISGFRDVIVMAGCLAVGNAVHGYARCANVSGGRSEANGTDGFNGSFRISACESDANLAFGYAGGNSGVSNAAGVGNVAGLSDLTNLLVDPVTAAGI